MLNKEKISNSKKISKKNISETLTSIEPELNLNISENEEMNQDFLYSWKVFGRRPNKTIIPGRFEAIKIWTYIEENLNYKEENIFIEKDIVNEFVVVTSYQKYLIQLDNNIIVSFKQMDEFYPEDNDSIVDIYGITIYYKDRNDFIKNLESDIVTLVEDESADEEMDQKREFKNKLLKFDNENGKFSLELIDSELIIDIDNIELYYNLDSFKKVKKWLKKLKSAKKGLSILFGDRGYGKTSTVSYLMKKLEQKFIYIPSHCIEHVLQNQEFLEVLRFNKDTIYVIDDCENYFNKSYQKTTTVVNNLLQMIDGLKSDSYNANFILIMNSNKNFADENLFECNNLIDIIELEKLNNNESTLLSEHLKINIKYTNSHRVNDIIKGIVKNEKGIGYI